MDNMVKKVKIRRILALTVAIFIFSIIIFLNPIIQGSNNKVFVPEPIFSAESGFYNEAFYLELSSEPGTEIYYTLDCSEPDENSTKYEDSILIEDVSQNENVYSMRTDVSAGFYVDLIEKFQTIDAAPMYVAPDYPVKKCVVVRAVAVDEKGNCSKANTKTYFVDKDLSFYNGCNIISIVTSPENLFDDNLGIYVTGDIFDNYILKNKVVKYWKHWDANYRQKGQEWERPVDFMFFDANGTLTLSSTGGIRTQGGISRGSLPRSLNLYVNDRYGEGSVMNDQLFYSEFIPNKVTLSAGGNRTITLFNDRMMSDRTQLLNFSKMTFEPYVLFLEGEYWGFYWLASAYDERYISFHYDVEEQDIVMVKTGELEIGDDADLSLYDDMKEYIVGNDMSVPDNYSHACELIDMDSFVDYYACMAYIARNEDWPHLNYALWRTRSVSEGKYSDGKWRWMLFDCNSSSMSEHFITHDTLSYIIEKDQIFASLWNNKDFQKAFEERIFYIADNCFDSNEMTDYIEDYKENMPTILEKSWARFYGSENNKETVFYSQMEEHKAFFNNRRETVSSWFEE